jgi:hypothetical protein
MRIIPIRSMTWRDRTFWGAPPGQPVRCEKSADDRSPKSGRVDDFEEACALGNLGPICEPAIRQARTLEPERCLGHASAMDSLPSPLAFLLLVFSGWVNRRQLAVIDYLLEENRILRAAHGPRRLRLTDDQRRRLALKGKVVLTKKSVLVVAVDVAGGDGYASRP